MEYIFLTIVTAEIIYCAVLMRQIESLISQVCALSQQVSFQVKRPHLVLILSNSSQISSVYTQEKSTQLKLALTRIFSLQKDRKLKLVVNETKD